jgi:hypothetical protein
MPRKVSGLDRARTFAAWTLLVGCLAGWPASALTWAKDEPQFVLGLSWMALVIESANLLTSSQVREGQKRE